MRLGALRWSDAIVATIETRPAQALDPADGELHGHTGRVAQYRLPGQVDRNHLSDELRRTSVLRVGIARP